MGRAAGTALRMLQASRAGDEATAQRLRDRLPALVETAKSYVYVDMNGKRVPVLVANGVVDTFVTDAIAEHDGKRGRS